jgi:hypothetical protein
LGQRPSSTSRLTHAPISFERALPLRILSVERECPRRRHQPQRFRDGLRRDRRRCRLERALRRTQAPSFTYSRTPAPRRCRPRTCGAAEPCAGRWPRRPPRRPALAIEVQVVVAEGEAQAVCAVVVAAGAPEREEVPPPLRRCVGMREPRLSK